MLESLGETPDFLPFIPFLSPNWGAGWKKGDRISIIKLKFASLSLIIRTFLKAWGDSYWCFTWILAVNTFVRSSLSHKCIIFFFFYSHSHTLCNDGIKWHSVRSINTRTDIKNGKNSRFASVLSFGHVTQVNAHFAKCPSYENPRDTFVYFGMWPLSHTAASWQQCWEDMSMEWKW